MGDGTFGVDFGKIKQAVIDLDREFLTIEATGDYARAKDMMTKYVVIRPEVQSGARQDEGRAQRYPPGIRHGARAGQGGEEISLSLTIVSLESRRICAGFFSSLFMK